jgi:hypothetical protein
MGTMLSIKNVQKDMEINGILRGWDITKILSSKDEQCQVKSFSNRC